jgi:hypothetical protein
MHICKRECSAAFIVLVATFSMRFENRQHPEALALTIPKCTLGAKLLAENRGTEPH